MKALRREVVRVVARLTGLLGPIDERGVAVLPHFLRLLVEQLLGHFFPGEAQVAHRGNGAQADGAARRKQQGAGVAVVVFGAEPVFDGPVGEVAGGEDVGQGNARDPAGAAALGQVDFDEAAVAAAHLGERVQGLDDAGTTSPAAARSSGERDDRDLSRSQSLEAERAAAIGKAGYGIADIAGRGVLDRCTGCQAILRETDAAGAQVGLDLLVLSAVEAVAVEQFVQASGLASAGRGGVGNQVIEELLHGARELGQIADGLTEAIELGAAGARQEPGLDAQEGRYHQRVVAGGHEALGAAKQACLGAALVDGEIVDHGLHGEGRGTLEAFLGGAHDVLEAVLRPRLALRIEDETHATAGGAAEHPESLEICAEFGTRAIDERFGVVVGGAGDDGLDRSQEIALGGVADAFDAARFEESDDLVEDSHRFEACLPLHLGAQQILLGDHLEDGADVLRHAAVDQHQAVLEALARFGRNLGAGEDVMAREQAAPADAELGIALGCFDALNQFHPRPEAAGILPAAAGAGQPFAEDGARGNGAAIVLGERAGEAVDLIGGAHARGDQAREQAGGDGEAGAFGNIVDAADDLDAVALASGEAREEIGQRLLRAFHRLRHQARGDGRGLQQTQVVAGEIEDLGEGGDVGGGAEIDAGEAQHRLIDDTEVGFDGGPGTSTVGSSDGEVDRNVEDAGAFREIHPEEKDVAPAAVAEVHADGRGLVQDGVQSAIRHEQLRPDR